MNKHTLTDEECIKFRQLPCSFNDMVRAIYEAGMSHNDNKIARNILSLLLRRSRKLNCCWCDTNCSCYDSSRELFIQYKIGKELLENLVNE